MMTRSRPSRVYILMLQPSSQRPALVWLSGDLRLDDQPALAAIGERPALIVYVDDDGGRPLGGASRWWLHHSLCALSKGIAARGGRLDILQGNAEALIPAIARAAGASDVFWGRRYGGGDVFRLTRLRAALEDAGIATQSFNTHLMREPWEVTAGDKRPYKVFTPFWRSHRALGPLAAPLPAPEHFVAAPWSDAAPARTDLTGLALLPTKPDWSGGLAAAWVPGEAAAQARLSAFLESALAAYANKRDFPDGDFTSRLSPHLAFGELSPRRIAHAVEAAAACEPAFARSAEKFLSELGWRDFDYGLLYAAPDLATRAWTEKFASFPFRDDEAAFSAWTKGQTGYPLVDAGMRELWTTGYMHNRVRMVAASFLVKHLLIDWRRGEQWFWDTLCDADEANNPANWQWVAGSGADAAPYFRIFNPALQGQRFDANGDYVRRWVPELADVDGATIYAPRRSGTTLGRGYREPIVEHDFARRRALAALASLSARPSD